MSGYVVKEMFRTVQGEGFHAGTPAFFVRMAGCNMWSGIDDHRERDAVRNGAECPRWCDTDFVGGENMSATAIAVAIERSHAVPLIVITGGEPLLQVDEELLDALSDRCPEARIAIETNGTVKPKFKRPAWGTIRPEHRPSQVPWITLSPKQSRASCKLDWANEIKLVWPAYDHMSWSDFPADHYFIQPQANKGERDEQAEHQAALLVADGFRWRLSLQGHKVTRMR